MILIKRHGFDNMENRDAEYETIIGYAVTDEKADEYISKRLETDIKYKGWDGNTYPFYSKQEVERVNTKRSNKEILESIKEKVEDLSSKTVYNFNDASADEILNQICHYIQLHRGRIPFVKVDVRMSCINDTLIPAMKKEPCLFIYDTSYEIIEEDGLNKTIISHIGAIPVTFFGVYDSNGKMAIETMQFIVVVNREVVEIEIQKENKS